MISNLNKLGKKDLLRVAAQHGCIVDGRHSEATIRQEIIKAIEVRPMARTESKPIEVKELHFLTPEEIEEALAPLKAKKPHFTTEYNLEEQTIHLRCRGAEECHNLSILLKHLKKRAEYVSRGALALHTRPEFERGTYKGYADTVLA